MRVGIHELLELGPLLIVLPVPLSRRLLRLVVGFICVLLGPLERGLFELALTSYQLALLGDQSWVAKEVVRGARRGRASEQASNLKLS